VLVSVCAAAALSFNEFSQLIEDCHLASNTSKSHRKADMDRTFIAANAASAKLSKSTGGSTGGRDNTLSIDEFVLA
jgi:hypothetical protein